jgi:hypothetical protein
VSTASKSAEAVAGVDAGAWLALLDAVAGLDAGELVLDEVHEASSRALAAIPVTNAATRTDP